MGFDYSGMSFQEQAADKGVSAATIFGFSLLFVFLILAALYESWLLPLAVMLIVPLCLLSAVSGVLLRGLDNNILVQVGFIVKRKSLHTIAEIEQAEMSGTNHTSG